MTGRADGGDLVLERRAIIGRDCLGGISHEACNAAEAQ